MLRVPKEIIRQVAETIERFQLLRQDEPFVLAYSGGKDSILAAMVLKELNYSFLACAVDMNYSERWGEGIIRNSEDLDIPVDIIDVRSVSSCGMFNDREQAFIYERFEELDALSSIPWYVTPCTQCYNVKITALSAFARKNDINRIVFAHHATDACSSFFKAVLMFIDRWIIGNERFDRERFLKLTRLAKKQLLNEKTDLSVPNIIDIAESLAQEGQVSTDEPPRERVTVGDKVIEILRPLFGIWESEIVSFQNAGGLKTEPSGCGHSLAVETQTPRELVHFGIIRPLESVRNNSHIVQKIMSIVTSTIEVDGCNKHDFRRMRNKILGAQYKPIFGSVDKL